MAKGVIMLFWESDGPLKYLLQSVQIYMREIGVAFDCIKTVGSFKYCINDDALQKCYGQQLRRA
jgi:hypothetical protein